MQKKDKTGGEYSAENNGGAFTYTYSAPTEEERREIESIRRAYAAPDAFDEKLEYVKKLDKRVRGVPAAAALCTGIAGMLMFGGGLSLSLEASSHAVLAGGIALGIAGFAVMAAAKFVHSRLSARMKKKYGATIIKLTDEMLGCLNTDKKIGSDFD